VRNTAHVVADLRAERREAAEMRRVLYVAMTRAKDRLILSGVAGAAKRSLLELVEEAAETTFAGLAGGDAEAPGGEPSGPPPASRSVELAVGPVKLPVTILAPSGAATPRKAPPAPPERETDWVGYRERWEARRARAGEVAAVRRFVSPSLLELERPDVDLFARDPAAPEPGKESAPTTRNEEQGTRNRCSSHPAIVGTICHRVLEHWDFDVPAKGLPDAVARVTVLLRESEERDDWEEAGRAALEILRAFHGSGAYAWIRRCEILGREIPVLMPHDGGQVMRGVIDLLVRDGKAVTVLDYKSDLVAKKDRKKKADEYRLQGGIYQEAVAKAAGVKAGFRLVFLRDGEIVDL
jgi:ATP-dependent helicase/nuclease subunit A